MNAFGFRSTLLVALLACAAPASPADDPPADLSGTWTWQWKDGEGMTHRHYLEVEGTGAKAAARERFDDQEGVKVDDLKVVGKSVRFTVRRGDRQAAYEGKLADPDTINGKVIVGTGNDQNEFGWTATREKLKKN